jgi:hypothetical protein
MELLPLEILGEIVKWLTPIEISKLSVVGNGMLRKILKILGVGNVMTYVNRWRCNGCNLIIAKLYNPPNRTGLCGHELNGLCVLCQKHIISYCWICDIKKGRLSCTRCRFAESTFEVRICIHGWTQMTCLSKPCWFKCNKTCTLWGPGTKCKLCGEEKEIPPDCLCEN